MSFVNLPFIKKNKGPRMETKPPEPKIMDNGEEIDEQEEHRQIAQGIADEAVKAVHAADGNRFHSAMEAYLEHMANKPETEDTEDVES
jgi:hypothetical protein